MSLPTKLRHSGIVRSTPASASGTFGANTGRGDALRSALTGLLLFIRNLPPSKLKGGRFQMFFFEKFWNDEGRAYHV
jgi:hypothetical protein